MLVDFFWIMEDVFFVDFDWFWRGWFYFIDYVDVLLDYVKYFWFNINNFVVEKVF